MPSPILQVNWHDFAFFDPVMYESLRQLIRHSQAGEADAVFAAMDLAFAIDLCKEEGAGQVTIFTILGHNIFCYWFFVQAFVRRNVYWEADIG